MRLREARCDIGQHERRLAGIEVIAYQPTRESHKKCVTHAHRNSNANTSAHKSGKPFYDQKPQARSAKSVSDRGIELIERFEQTPVVTRRDTNPE